MAVAIAIIVAYGAQRVNQQCLLNYMKTKNDHPSSCFFENPLTIKYESTLPGLTVCMIFVFLCLFLCVCTFVHACVCVHVCVCVTTISFNFVGCCAKENSNCHYICNHLLGVWAFLPSGYGPRQAHQILWLCIILFTIAPDVNPMKRLILLYIVTFGIRGRYYFGWLIGRYMVLKLYPSYV